MTRVEPKIGLGLRLHALLGPAAMGLGFLVVVALASSTLWLIERTRISSAWVNHSYAVQRAIARLRADVNASESARRGFLLDPDPILDNAFRVASARVPEDLARLRGLLRDSPWQAARLAEFDALLEEHLRAQATSIIGVRVGARVPAVQAFSRDGSGARIERLEAVLTRMTEHEAGLLSLRTARETANLQLLYTATVAGVALIALLGLLSIAAYARDASALEASREELRLLNADLERAVAERTADLELAIAEIQGFAHIVSHDLRAPLVNVVGFTNELQRVREELDAPQQPETLRQDMDEAIRFIRASAEKMDRLINSILRMAREGRRTLTPQTIDFNDLINVQIATLSHAAQHGRVEIAIEGALPAIVSDRLALEQVFGNLIDNAIKYSKPDRPGRVTVRGKEVGGWVEVEIEDDGIGIDPKDHARVFDMFRRAGGGEQPGEGVGLAYTRLILRRLGGVIYLQSRKGEGALFRVRLPGRLAYQGRDHE